MVQRCGLVLSFSFEVSWEERVGGGGGVANRFAYIDPKENIVANQSV